MNEPRWNAYADAPPECRVWQRCGVCRKRWIVGMFHEVHALDDHVWTYACQPCTLGVAGRVIDRLHERIGKSMRLLGRVVKHMQGENVNDLSCRAEAEWFLEEERRHNP